MMARVFCAFAAMRDSTSAAINWTFYRSLFTGAVTVSFVFHFWPRKPSPPKSREASQRV
jgi:hypothetical protein